MEKHTPYFTVLETIQKVGDCGLCVLEKEAVRSFFDAFLYENVNDPASRQGLRGSRGYCPYHAHYLVGFHDTLAYSILYKEQSLLAASFFEKNRSHHNLVAEWNKHDQCPACLQTTEIRKHYVAILTYGLKEPEMRKAFLDHFHVCLHHLLLVLDSLHDQVLKQELIEKMRGRLVDVADRLEQYCQDSQKVAIGEVSDSPHRNAWEEAVATAVGLKDVFEPLI